MGTQSSTQTLQNIYQEVLGVRVDRKQFLWKHRGGFVHYIQTAIEDGLLEPGLGRKYFKLEKLSYALKPERDDLLIAKSISDLDKHLLKDSSGKTIETPQYYWMRLAMTRSRQAANPTRAALVVYDQLSSAPQLDI